MGGPIGFWDMFPPPQLAARIRQTPATAKHRMDDGFERRLGRRTNGVAFIDILPASFLISIVTTLGPWNVEGPFPIPLMARSSGTCQRFDPLFSVSVGRV